jgi:methylglyoxal synthase
MKSRNIIVLTTTDKMSELVEWCRNNIHYLKCHNLHTTTVIAELLRDIAVIAHHIDSTGETSTVEFVSLKGNVKTTLHYNNVNQQLVELITNNNIDGFVYFCDKLDDNLEQLAITYNMPYATNKDNDYRIISLLTSD